MFQGSQNLGKMEFVKLVQQNGGILNGSTRFDFTNYFETLPCNKLETALWAEADRMGGLAVNEDNLKNQQGVVGNEVKVNVLNQPYGGFPWLDMPQYANTNWYNAHNFYGDLKDIEAATLTTCSHSSTPITRRTTRRWRLSAISIRRKPRNSWRNISAPMKSSPIAAAARSDRAPPGKEKHATKTGSAGAAAGAGASATTCRTATRPSITPWA